MQTTENEEFELKAMMMEMASAKPTICKDGLQAIEALKSPLVLVLREAASEGQSDEYTSFMCLAPSR